MKVFGSFLQKRTERKRFFLKKEAKTSIRSAPKHRNSVHPIALGQGAGRLPARGVNGYT
jgi:hypothetical protein